MSLAISIVILTLGNLLWIWYIGIKQPRDLRRTAMKRRMKELGCYKPCNIQSCECHGPGKWGRLF